MKKIFLILTIFLPLAFFSCSEEKVVIPDDVMSEKEMTSILSDIHIAQAAMNNRIGADTSGFRMTDYINYILQQHKTDKKYFQNSLRFYSSHPELFKEVYDSVMTNLTRMETEVESDKSKKQN